MEFHELRQFHQYDEECFQLRHNVSQSSLGNDRENKRQISIDRSPYKSFLGNENFLSNISLKHLFLNTVQFH